MEKLIAAINKLLDLFRKRFPEVLGTLDYCAGVNGTETLTTGKRVLGITAHATTAGSMTINGGDSIAIPANSGVSFTPQGNLVDPTVIFTGTDSYIIEFVS